MFPNPQRLSPQRLFIRALIAGPQCSFRMFMDLFVFWVGGGGCPHLICALESSHLWQNKGCIGGDKAPETERPVRKSQWYSGEITIVSPETMAMDGKKWMDLRNTHEVESSVFGLWLHLEVGGGKQSLRWLHFKTLKKQSWMACKVCGLWYEKKYNPFKTYPQSYEEK